MSKHEAHGGSLINLVASEKKQKELKNEATTIEGITLTQRQECDLELLMNGGFSPLNGFLNKADYESVLDNLRLTSGEVWPIPVTLDVTRDLAKRLKSGDKVALRTEEGVTLAILTVGDIWKPNKSEEAEKVYGADDEAHPAVQYLHRQAHEYYIGGEIEGLELPHHYDFQEYRKTPQELRDEFKENGWDKVVAFQTRNPMHRAHVELAMRASNETGAKLLIHPAVGMTKPGDVDHYTRVRVYKEVIKKFPENSAMISLLPLAMRMGGPREALWHTIIRKNYGATHFIIGRDHAGPGKNSDGEDFYGPYEAQELVEEYADELDMTIVPFRMMVYVPKKDEYHAIDDLNEDEEHWSISGTELRGKLASGEKLPEWFTYPEVEKELRKTHKAKHQQGFTVFFTGLSGSGKSTLANALMVRLNELGGRHVTLLDGDIVRTHLSSELGFSKEHRDINVKRIGFVAAEIAKNGGIALCAPIAPYDNVRKEVRDMVYKGGGDFLLVHVATPLEECERRDRKGLYAQARAGKIKNFTGIDDPYEAPKDAELSIDTTGKHPSEAVDEILNYIQEKGFYTPVGTEK